MNDKEKREIIELFVDRHWIKPNIFIRPFLKICGRPTTREEMINSLLRLE